METSEIQISGFAVTEKAPSPEKKDFLQKKLFQLICADMIFKTCAEIFIE